MSATVPRANTTNVKHLRIIIIGAGYTGLAIATSARAAGHAVLLTVTTDDKAAKLRRDGFDAITFDADHQLSLDTDFRGESAVITVPPSRSAPRVRGVHAVAALLDTGFRRLVYLSSTAVYGDHDGGDIDGHTPVSPLSARGQRRLDAELAVRIACADLSRECAILRLPGIYGPGRTLLPRMKSGDYRLVGGGHRRSNRVHVDDAAAAVLALLSADSFTQPAYVAADDGLYTSRSLARALCDATGLPMPPDVALDEIPEARHAFWLGDRRATSPGLRALGWTPRWPDSARGILAAAGVTPEPSESS